MKILQNQTSFCPTPHTNFQEKYGLIYVTILTEVLGISVVL